MKRSRDEQRARFSLWKRAGAACTSVLAALAGCAHEAPKPPNVVLISIDTLRADHLPCYGYERDTAPFLSQLASEGAVFERAFAPTSWTLPSHLSMLTGVPISAHGVCDDRLWTRKDANGAPRPVPLRGTFVSEVLSDAGYACGGFYTWKYLDEQFGFGPGFETWERWGHTFYSHPVVAPEFERLRKAGDVDGMKRLAADHPDLFDDTRPSSPEVIDRALEWVGGRSDSDQPFFLFLHLFDVHDPYTPPAPFAQRFDPDYAGPIDGRRVTAPDSPVRRDMPARDLEHLIALYDGEIAWVDSQVRDFLGRLDALELGDDTLLIVTSDHGEEFFEHGHKTHRRQLYTESVHIPLIVRWPGSIPAGTRIESMVGLVDIAPTLYAAAGVEAPPPTAGVDLVAAARAGRSGERTYTTELFVFSGDSVPEHHLGLARGTDYMIRTAPSEGTARWEYFDLAQDPSGLAPKSTFEPEEERAVAEHLAQLRASYESLRSRLEIRSEDLSPLDEHDIKQLASMGYAGLEDDAEESEGSTGLCLDGCVWRDLR